MAELDPVQTITVFAIAAFFIIWYYGAFVYSRRLAARVARELKDAVLALGGTSQIRWFGTGAFRMTTEGATAPFREFSVTVTLRPREMPINWAIGKAQRRQDAALVEASLQKEPKVAFELVDPRPGRCRVGTHEAAYEIGGANLGLFGTKHYVVLHVAYRCEETQRLVDLRFMHKGPTETLEGLLPSLERARCH